MRDPHTPRRIAARRPRDGTPLRHVHVAGPRVGFQLTAIFLRDLEAATEIRLEEWEKRGLWRKLTEKFCALFRGML